MKIRRKISSILFMKLNLSTGLLIRFLTIFNLPILLILKLPDLFGTNFMIKY